MWLDKVKRAYGDDLSITWRNFSLEQNAHNLKEGLESDWKVWDDEDASQHRSLVSQIAAEAAKRQGDDLHAAFHLALLVARHGGEGRISSATKRLSSKLPQTSVLTPVECERT